MIPPDAAALIGRGGINIHKDTFYLFEILIFSFQKREQNSFTNIVESFIEESIWD